MAPWERTTRPWALMGKQSHLGPMFQAEDLKELVHLGHELGCHTFGHCHSWNTPPDVYERAIIENQKALSELLPGGSFRTFAYPHSAPRLAVKKVAGRYFLCCRGGGMKAGRYLLRHAAGGQTFNSGITDLNYLCAFFLEKSRGNPEAVKSLIDQNARARGWLIFATHDVCTDPSPFRVHSRFLRAGCAMGFRIRRADSAGCGGFGSTPSLAVEVMHGRSVPTRAGEAVGRPAWSNRQ